MLLNGRFDTLLILLFQFSLKMVVILVIATDYYNFKSIVVGGMIIIMAFHNVYLSGRSILMVQVSIRGVLHMRLRRLSQCDLDSVTTVMAV